MTNRDQEHERIRLNLPGGQRLDTVLHCTYDGERGRDDEQIHILVWTAQRGEVESGRMSAQYSSTLERLLRSAHVYCAVGPQFS